MSFNRELQNLEIQKLGSLYPYLNIHPLLCTLNSVFNKHGSNYRTNVELNTFKSTGRPKKSKIAARSSHNMKSLRYLMKSIDKSEGQNEWR